MRTHHRTCHLCEAMCGLVIEVEGDVIHTIRGDEADPLSRGHICPKAVALEDVHNDPDRLRKPVRRVGDSWEEIGWDDAFALVQERIGAVREAHGLDAVAIYLGNPNVHNLGALLFAPELTRALRTKNRFSATSVDQLAHHFVAQALYGHQLLLPIPDIDRTSHLLLFGSNPLASNGSLMTVPDVKRRLAAVRERGGRVVLVDPRRTESAAHADTHIFIRPGTDALMLAAMLRTVFEEGLVARGGAAALLDGAEELRAAVQPFEPERVAPRCGVEADRIRQLTRDFAGAESAAAHGRLGVSTQVFGGLCQWFIQALNALTGNLDRPGGTLFTRPAVDALPLAPAGRSGRWRSRVRQRPEFGGELPVAVLAEEIRAEGAGQIRALITVAGNPVLSTPDGPGLDGALGELDFMVSIDPYINETTRRAHVILPPVSPLERDHYDLVFHLLAVRNTAKYSPALFPRPDDGRHDWEILAELEQRLAVRRGPKATLVRRARRYLGPRRLLALALRMGPYGKKLWPFGGLTLSSLDKAPHGIDLGPLEPSLPQRLRTPNQRIPLAPAHLLADIPRLTACLDAPPPEGLLLIGRRHVRSNNSWMHNYRRLVRGKNRCTLMIHPTDAAARGLENGAMARVTSRVGEVCAPVEITDAVMPSVVSLPHGYGHDRPGARLQVAAEHAGVSINDLTDPQALDELTGAAILSGVPVEVGPVER